MDEPFGELDVVTMGDRVMVLNDGEIQQFDTSKELLFNPANDYVVSLFAADTIVKKLQYFNVSDFPELIRPSTENRYPAITLDDSMETVTNHVLLGNRYLSVFDEDRHLGNLDCNQLKKLGE